MYELPSLPSWKRCLLIALAFFAASALVYGHSLGNPFVRWDDGMLIYENPAIRAINPWTLWHIFTTYDPELYIPLTFFTYQIDYLLGGTDPFFFHFGNFVLHTLNALLVAWFGFLILRNRLLALLLGGLFLLHPLHTEAVLWASARKDVLSTFFFLFSLISYIYFKDQDSRKWYFLSLATFALGLMAKVSVIMLPFILLLLDFRAKRPLLRVSQIKEKWPYILIAVIFAVIAFFGKQQLVEATTFSQKILMAQRSAVFYLQQIFYPKTFSLLYPFTEDVSFSTPIILYSVIAVVIISVIVLASLRFTREVFFGMAFYLLMVAPTFGNFAKGGDMDVYFASDRYAYIGSIGVFYIVCFVLALALTRVRDSLRDRIIAGISIVLVAGLGFLSYRQSFVWENTESLFRHVIKVFPASSHVAHNNLGNAYRLQGDLEKAIIEYELALKVREHAKILSNLGATLRRMGQMDEALAAYDRAIQVDSESEFAHAGLGLIYTQQGRFSDAEREYQLALTYAPNYEEAASNLGDVYAKQGRWQEAADTLEEALRINPFLPEGIFNLAVAYTKLGRVNDAITHYEDLLRLVPQMVSARINLGILYHQVGEAERAAHQFRTILSLDPNNAAAKEALRQMGQ